MERRGGEKTNRKSNLQSSRLDRFIAGGFFTIFGIYELPQSWQTGFLLFGLGMVLLMSVDKEKMDRFINFFWDIFKQALRI